MLKRRKSCLFLIIISLLAFSLVSCGKKPLDMKLDYSSVQQLDKSFEEAVRDANPEQQTVIKRYADNVFKYAGEVNKKSNPEVSGRNEAPKYAEEFGKLKEMTVRQLWIHYLTNQKKWLENVTSSQEEFVNNFLVGKAEIKRSDPERGNMEGLIILLNKSDKFDYNLPYSSEISLVLENGKVLSGSTSNSALNRGRLLDGSFGASVSDRTLMDAMLRANSSNTYYFEYSVKEEDRALVEEYLTQKKSPWFKVRINGEISPAGLITEKTRFNDPNIKAQIISMEKYPEYKERLKIINADIAVLEK